MSEYSFSYGNNQSIKCESYSLVVLMQSLTEKFTGGIKEFFDRFNPVWNYDLAVLCSGIDKSVDPVVQELLEHGFKHPVDYITFTAHRIFSVAKRMEQFQEIQFTCPWLLGECRQGGVYVWYRNYRKDVQ